MREKLWTRNFVLAIGTNLFIYMVFYLLMTSMALYALERFQAADSAAGFASSAFIVGALVSRFFAGILLDKVGRRRILLLALLVFVAVSVLYIPAGSLELLLVLRLVHGAAFGLAHTAVTTGAQALIPQARRSEGTGYFASSTTIATALGPFLAVLLANGADFQAVFWFSAGCSAAAFAVALALRLPENDDDEGPIDGEAEPEGRAARVLAAVIEPRALPVASIVLVAGLAYSGVLSFLTSYAAASGDPSAAGLYFLVFAAAVLVSRLSVGRLHDRRGDNVVMYPSLLIFAVGLAVLAAGSSPATVTVAGILTGFGFGTLVPCSQAIVVNAVQARRLGTAIATYYLMFDVGTGFGPVLLGLLIPLAGYQGMYVATGVLMIACIGLYFAVHGRRTPSETTRV
ncbi:MFS transporter [Crystallibacter degradans]|uniref:MFS transporter n=1 Tax=Crystallibacter degradans TaxID=2726743 RepID=UPI001F0F4F8A|nr:MFS transporter [Arthrobacter sp. SF27]